MGSLVEHARRELELCGQYAEDPAYAQSIIAAVAAFASYDGHSGGSASIAGRQLAKLLDYQALSPLTDDPDEWDDVSEKSCFPTWQNVRDSRAFSGDGGKTYRINGEIETRTSEPSTRNEPRPECPAIGIDPERDEG